MGDIKLKVGNSTSDVGKSEDFPTLPEKLVVATTPEDLQTKVTEVYKSAEQELLTMRMELSEVPNTESLMKLYELQAKGRAYYERSAEMFRQFLRISSEATLIRQQATFRYENVYQDVYLYAKKHMAEDLRNTKSGTEREALISSLIPYELKKEKLNWESTESKIRVYYNLIKSYQEQFKSVREDILVQLSIIKNLILLGGVQVDAEAMRFFKIVEASYTPSGKDFREKAEASQQPEVSLEEGLIQL